MNNKYIYLNGAVVKWGIRLWRGIICK